MLCCDFFLWLSVGMGVGGWVGGKVCTRWVGLHVIAENTKIYSYLHVVNILYPHDDS